MDTARCLECGTLQHFGDPDFLAPCSSCTSTNSVILHCARCPTEMIDHYRSNSGAGKLLERVLDLDGYLKRYQIGWDNINAEEHRALTILENERAAWVQEDAEDKRREQEMRMRMEEAKQRGQRGGGV